MQTLDTLSQTQNVLGVGINALLKEAGVAKASLYDHFGSKEALIVAWLDQQQIRWFGYFDAHVAAKAGLGEPARELDAAFSFLEAWLARDDFAGCPFLTTYLQLRSADHPAGLRARQYSDRLYAFFRSRLHALGVSNSRELATSYLELFLGAIVVQQLGSGTRAARSARRTARALLEGAV